MQVDFFILSMRREDAPKILGRQNALTSLKDGLPGIGCRSHWLTLRIPSNQLLALALGVVRWIGSGLRGRVLPLQSVLALQGWVRTPPRFATERGRDRSGTSPIIYVDGVRLAQLGVGLRRRIGGRLLIDFDDLMSRRAGRMLRQREDVSFGAFAGIVPAPIKVLVRALGPVQALLLSWEKRLLRRAELDAARTADAIAFASAYEARLFRRFQRRHAPDANPAYLLLGPSTPQFEEVAGGALPCQPPQDLRFIFIGSDLLEQNRIAIEEIIRLSHEGALALPAYIYGRMTRHYQPTDKVVFCGFAEDLAQVYQPGSILLMARSVRGGVKSKILEAFEHGIPTIGTSSALEDFEGPYRWRVDGTALRQLVGDPSALSQGYQEAVAAGIAICRVRFSSRRYWQVLSDYANSGERRACRGGQFAHPPGQRFGWFAADRQGSVRS
jgi:glycosyltransferase involved in cell wall biosynthesis